MNQLSHNISTILHSENNRLARIKMETEKIKYLLGLING